MIWDTEIWLYRKRESLLVSQNRAQTLPLLCFFLRARSDKVYWCKVGKEQQTKSTCSKVSGTYWSSEGDRVLWDAAELFLVFFVWVLNACIHHTLSQEASRESSIAFRGWYSSFLSILQMLVPPAELSILHLSAFQLKHQLPSTITISTFHFPPSSTLLFFPLCRHEGSCFFLTLFVIVSCSRVVFG